MLILTRKVDEQIVMQTADGEILITVVEIDRGKVRIGINAPARVPVDRKEVAEAKARGAGTPVARRRPAG